MYATRGDPVSLADSLATCLFPPVDAPDLYVKKGRRLRQRAVQSFGWEKAGQQILESYGELVGRVVTPSTVAQPWSAESVIRR